MAIRAKYFLQVHPLVVSEDLPNLPTVLKADFEDLFKPILQSTPDTGGILSCHRNNTVSGKLSALALRGKRARQFIALNLSAN